jgi:hypothetical protein
VSDDLESIADELVLCRADPVRFVETMFDWQSPELKGKAPESWQRQVLEAIRDGLPLGKAVRLAVASGHGVGKALGHGEPVLTPTGWRSIESLRVDDLVIAGRRPASSGCFHKEAGNCTGSRSMMVAALLSMPNTNG